MLKNRKQRAYSPKGCSPSPVMVTSPYERTILERDANKQTNKQTIEQVSFMSNQQPFATKHPMVKLFEESYFFSK